MNFKKLLRPTVRDVHLNQTYTVPETVTADAVIDALSAAFQLRAEPATTAVETFYDTPDWRLFTSNQALVGIGHACELRNGTDTVQREKLPQRARFLPMHSPRARFGHS